MSTATITGRGMMHIPSELQRRYGLKPGDKVDLRPTRRGILIERIPTLEEAFGMFPRGRQGALELLDEKRAELRREEEEIRRWRERRR